MYLTRAVWTPGLLLMGDHPLHESLLVCLHDSGQWLMTSARCPYLPQYNDMYTFFPPLFYLIVLLFAKIVSLELAYKIALMLVWFFIPPVVCALFLRLKKY